MTAVSPARAARCLAVVLFSLIGGVAGAQSRAAPAADTTQAQVPLLPGPANLAITLRPEFAGGGDARRIAVEIAFDAGNRTRTPLVVPRAWAGASDLGRGIRNLRAVSADARIASNAAGETAIVHGARGSVRLRYELVEYGDTAIDRLRFYQPILRRDHAFFFGHGAFVLPAFDAGQGLALRIAVNDLPAGWRAASSFGVHAEAARDVVWEARDLPASQLRNGVFALGDFRLQRAEIERQAVWFAMRGTFGFSDATFVERTVALIRAHRDFFADHAAPFMLLTLLPNDQPQGSVGGTAVYRAFAMHASADFTVPGEAYDFLVAHEHLHTWMPGRFGTMTTAPGHDDEALRYWFSEGLTNWLTHRLLLQTGQWSLDDYGRALNRVIEKYEMSPARRRDNAAVQAAFFSDPIVGELAYQRGELLALTWDAALRARGSNLAQVLRPLLLPPGPSQERPPLATERVLDALQAQLGEAPRRDVARVVEQAGAVDYREDLLGPCFARQTTSFSRWELGFDGDVSFRERRISGLVAGSAAQRAGLVEGDLLRGYSVRFNDVDSAVLLQVERNRQLVDIRYLPRSTATVPGVRYLLKPDAQQDADCAAWRGFR